MTNTKASTVRWDPVVLKELQAYAKRRRMSVNAAANLLVERALILWEREGIEPQK